MSLGLALFGGEVLAQVDVGRTPATAPALGTIVRGASATTFSVSTGGTVTRPSGDAIRLSSSSVTTPTITLSCGLLNLSALCALRQMRVTIQATGASADATISRFRVSSLSGASYHSGAPSEGGSITFDLNPIGITGGVSFKLGMDVLVPAGSGSGANTFTYTVSAALL